MSGLKRSALSLAAVALMTGGCATGYETARPHTSLDEGPTTVQVSNQNWSDMNIYLVVNGMRRRLGSVTSNSTGTFKVPDYALASSGRVYLLADPIGSNQTYQSSPVLLNAGQTAEWRLENAIQLSSLWIR